MNSLVNYNESDEESNTEPIVTTSKDIHIHPQEPNTIKERHCEKTENLENLELLESRSRLYKLIAPSIPVSDLLSLLPPLCTDTSKVDPVQMQRIQHFYNLREERGLSFIPHLEQSHAFRNPSIMQKMIEFMNLDQYGHEFFSSNRRDSSASQGYLDFKSTPTDNTRKKDYIEFVPYRK